MLPPRTLTLPLPPVTETRLCASSVGVAPLTIGEAMSEPARERSRKFALWASRRATTTSAPPRDVREKRQNRLSA
jgi:hypothetical protein